MYIIFIYLVVEKLPTKNHDLQNNLSSKPSIIEIVIIIIIEVEIFNNFPTTENNSIESKMRHAYLQENRDALTYMYYKSGNDWIEITSFKGDANL